MTQRTEALAAAFEGAANRFVLAVEGLSDKAWGTTPAGEQRSASQIASHMAEVYQNVGEWILQAAAGQPLPPLTMDDIHSMNAEQAARYAGAERARTLELLRHNSAATAAALIALLNKPDELAACGARARTLAQEFAWERALGPLVQFCQQPHAGKRTAPLLPAIYRKPGKTVMREQERDLIRHLEASWQLEAPAGKGLRGLAQRLAWRALAPLLAQQRQFNAALLKILYVRSEASDEEP